jgi:D-amino-acid dehydrogenase
MVAAEISGVERARRRWRLTGNGPELSADQIAVTLGPWSKRLLDGSGLKLPMGIKRGYHRHYAPEGNSYLTRPLLDEGVGYVMAPMARGIRLTSGAEFARQDAPKTPNQLAPHPAEGARTVSARRKRRRGSLDGRAAGLSRTCCR